MLRQRDAAAGDKGDIVSFAVFDQGLVDPAGHVLDEQGVFSSDLPPVRVGDDMNDLHVAIGEFDSPLHSVGRQFHLHRNDDPGMDLLQFLDPALHIPIILYFRKPCLFHYFPGNHPRAGSEVKGDVGQDFVGGLFEKAPFLRIHDGDEPRLHRRLCDHRIELREGVLPRNPVDDQGHRDRQDRREGGNHLIAVCGEKRRFLPDIDGRADVFAPVDAVAGRPHDLRHIGPHRIEAFAGKSPAVPRPGNGDLRRLRLGPGGLNDLGRPIAVAEFLVFGVDGEAQKIFCAVLDAGEAAHAVEEKGVHVFYITDIFYLIPVPVVDTGLLDTVMTSGAVFPPVHDAVLADAGAPGGDRFCRDVVFFWHMISSISTLSFTGQSGGGENRRQCCFFPTRKKVYPAQSAHAFEFIDRLDTNRQPLFLLRLGIPGGFQPFNNRGGYLELGVLLRKSFRFLDTLQGENPRQNRRLAGYAGLLCRIQPNPELIDVKHGVGLDEIRPGFDLLCQPEDAKINGFQTGVCDGARNHRKGTSYPCAVQEFSPVAHLRDDGDQLGGVEIVDVRRLGVVR